MLIQKLPDFEGGFITKSIEGVRIITRDAEGNILCDKPINLVRKGIVTNFGKVTECGDDFVIIKSGLKTIRANKHLLNTSLHKSIEFSEPQIAYTESGTFETPIGNVLVDNVTDDIRATITNPDYITHTATYSIFHKSINSKLIRARVEEPLFKSAFLKSVKVETIGRPLKLFKSTVKIFDISKTGTGGMAWNAKGGMKSDHKYLERKPNPSGEGYIYLYELPNGKKEWRDKSGEAIQEQTARKEYTIDYKLGEAVRIGRKIGLIKEVSDNFLAVNVEGKMITINKNEHLQKLDEQKGYYEGAEITHEGNKVKILKLTGSLALAKDLRTNRMKVIEVEQPISRADDVNTKEYKQSIKDKYSHITQGYANEDYAYNLEFEKQPAYNQFWDVAKKEGFGRVDELTARKFVKISDTETDNITWKYNPETGDTEFLINGQEDYPLNYEGKKYFVRNITKDGYSLEDPKTKETGLFLAHSDYKKFKQSELEKEKSRDIVTRNVDPYGGITIGEKTDKINIKPEYTEEQLARFNRKQFGGRWGKAQQAKQTAEKIKQENEERQKALKEKLNGEEYKGFKSKLEERGYKLTENVFRAKKEVEIEGRKFKLTKTFDGSTEIDGPTDKLKLGNDIHSITDIVKTKKENQKKSYREFSAGKMSRYMKELGGHSPAVKKMSEEWKEYNKTTGAKENFSEEVRVYYDNNGKEESKTLDELKTINGKNIFEPTRASKGIISNLPATKIYFGMDDKDTASGYYEIVEVDELVPSNSAGGEANPNYTIGSAQNRDRSKLQSLAQVEKIANKPNFDFLGDDKTAQNGAPIVNQDYNVIAGNGRAIGLIKHYEIGQDKYKNDLVANAKRLGFDADEIGKMKNPVLVRRTNVSNEEAQRLGAISNQDQKLALEERETAKGMATRVDDATFNKIADMFSNAKGDYVSISDYLEDVGPQLVKELIKRNIIPENEQHLFYDLNSGKLNVSHKDKVKQLLTQSVLGDSSAHFEKISNAAREGITKGLGDIFALKGKAGDLVPNITEAVKLLSKYEAMKENFKSPDDFISQAANDAFEPLSADKKTLALFDLFAGTKPNEMKDKLREYRMSMEPDMFSAGLKSDAAFDQTFKPKYEKGINKSLISRIKLFGKRLMKAVDVTKNVLLPSKKNPSVRRWQSTEEANKWIDDKSKEYGSKNKFLASNKYRNAYSEINNLHKQNKNKFTDEVNKAMEEVGAKFGDKVEYSTASPFGEVFVYVGGIINRNGVPYVKLDQKTRDGKSSVRWHKGFKKVNEQKIAESNNLQVVKEDGKLIIKRKEKIEKEENTPQMPEGKSKKQQKIYKLIQSLMDEERWQGIEYPKSKAYENYYNDLMSSPSDKETLKITKELDDYLKTGDKFSLLDNRLADEVRKQLFELIAEKRREINKGYDTINLRGFIEDLKKDIEEVDLGKEYNDVIKRVEEIEANLKDPSHIGLYEESQFPTLRQEIKHNVEMLKKVTKRNSLFYMEDKIPALNKIIDNILKSDKYEPDKKQTPQTETENFKMWFGDSKVVDEKGEPLKVFHGTVGNFTKFDISKIGENFGFDDAGFFFTTDPEEAAEPPGDKQEGINLMPVYLKIGNPLHIRTKGSTSEYFDDHSVEILDKAKQNKNDGVIIDGGVGGRLAVVFKPTQIKSAIGNDGSFDPDDPDITKSVGAKSL